MKQRQEDSDFLLWNEKIVFDTGQDPLGLNLRVSARLSSQLLFCITSVTQRARYYSFLPWCVNDYIKAQKAGSTASLDDIIFIRERALVLGSVLNHNGNSCDGGGLVGYLKAKNWYLQQKETTVDLNKIKLYEKPAWDVYKGSLANLGIFENVEQISSEQEEDEREDELLNGENIKLSKVGQLVADSYEKNIAQLKCTSQLRNTPDKCSTESLKAFGQIGGLCELRNDVSIDRNILREVFFNEQKTSNPSKSHEYRKHSLLLLLYLVDFCSKENLSLTETNFRHAVYYGEIVKQSKTKLQIQMPTTLLDIATRWRMFYFHHYLTVGLESLFAHSVHKAKDAGISGITVESIIADLHSSHARLNTRKELTFLPAFTFQQVLNANGADFPQNSRDCGIFDAQITVDCVLSEESLQNFLSDNARLHSPQGLSSGTAIILMTLARYQKWNSKNSDYGNWLSQSVTDDYLDVTVSTIYKDLNERFGEFWSVPIGSLLKFILFRYVLRQHQELSYVKSWDGNNMIISCDQDSVFWRNSDFETFTAGNPRFSNAMQILEDLGYIEGFINVDSIERLTPAGKKCLEAALGNSK